MSDLDDLRARLAAWKEDVENLYQATGMIRDKAESWRQAILEMTGELQSAAALFAERSSAIAGEILDITGDDIPPGAMDALEGLSGVTEALDGMSSRLLAFELGLDSNIVNEIGVQASGAAQHANRADHEAGEINL